VSQEYGDFPYLVVGSFAEISRNQPTLLAPYQFIVSVTKSTALAKKQHPHDDRRDGKGSADFEVFPK
jgi:hypothetical protein